MTQGRVEAKGGRASHSQGVQTHAFGLFFLRATHCQHAAVVLGSICVLRVFGLMLTTRALVAQNGHSRHLTLLQLQPPQRYS